MKLKILRKILVVIIILTPMFADMGCKKQPKCGCNKDVIFDLTDGASYVYYTTSGTVYFYGINSSGSSYYFCNPAKWITFLQKYPQGQMLLVTGKAFYECNYLMNSGNMGYYIPPVYQVEVTDLKEDSYGKKK
jgi:hypothetical protein